MSCSDNYSVCVTCGTQFGIEYDSRPATCRMCDGNYTNEIKQDPIDGRIWSIFSRPQFAIGQRALFIQTEAGNVLWDCITYLDEATIKFIKERGGLKAIAISHPHFYSSHLEWAREFDCPVYLADEDQEWLNREDTQGKRIFYKGEHIEILPGVNMVKLGGHFPGSSALHWNNNLFVGDSIGVSLVSFNIGNAIAQTNSPLVWPQSLAPQ
ncbi:hypothetical protein Golomagni_06977 [Golovinomyces magnicellulatus]|nr:hypothetical protein Golomagni_06977 [Golovinomyces magnicellulatus]